MTYLRDFSLLFWYNESIKIKAVFPMMTQNADKKREQIQMFCMCHNTSMGQGCHPGRIIKFFPLSDNRHSLLL